MKRYVLGFMFSRNLREVALIRKTHRSGRKAISMASAALSSLGRYQSVR